MNLKFAHPDHDSELLKESILEILDSTELWSMATVTPENRSHINTAYFSYDRDFNFYFITSPHTEHGKNISSNPIVAVTIFNTNQPWKKVPFRGIQLWGNARDLNIFAYPGVARESYCSRFSDADEWIGPPKTERAEDVHDRFFEVVPFRLKLFDEKIFGLHTLIELNLESNN
jgi:uncharacterized protein YhbP (UPF0306 family)